MPASEAEPRSSVSRGRPEWLGYHNFAGLLERTTSDFVQHYALLRNTNNATMGTVAQFPVAGVTDIQSASNMIAAINYIDPQRPETWAFPDLYPRYPHLLFDGSVKPAPTPTASLPPGSSIPARVRCRRSGQRCS